MNEDSDRIFILGEVVGDDTEDLSDLLGDILAGEDASLPFLEKDNERDILLLTEIE